VAARQLHRYWGDFDETSLERILMADVIQIEPISVVDSCGKRLGVADQMYNGLLRLKSGSTGDFRRHYIPMRFVERIDRFIHLKISSDEVRRRWRV
jgi:hypothetical protein